MSKKLSAKELEIEGKKQIVQDNIDKKYELAAEINTQDVNYENLEKRKKQLKNEIDSVISELDSTRYGKNEISKGFYDIESKRNIAVEKLEKSVQAKEQNMQKLKQYEDEMKRASDELTKKFTEYQQEQANLPKNIQERRQKELQELNEKGMQFQADAQQQLQKAYAEMMEPIYKKIDDAIKAVGQEGGYVYIFDLNRTDIPFVNESLSTDVTPAVKGKLGLK